MFVSPRRMLDDERVTGGGGFLSSHLAEALVDGDWTVRVLAEFSTGKRTSLAAIASRIKIAEGSVTDPGVANAVRGLLKAARTPAASGHVCNIGAGGSVRLLDLLRHLNECLGTDRQPTFGTGRAGDVRHSQADISRARQDLGYEPAGSFQDGLRQIISSLG